MATTPSKGFFAFKDLTHHSACCKYFVYILYNTVHIFLFYRLKNEPREGVALSAFIFGPINMHCCEQVKLLKGEI
jgi:hypothetical protein